MFSMPRRNFATLTLLAAAIALARLMFLHDLPEWDQSTYFLIGDALLHGKKLYLDIWDMKPPAIFATYAIAEAITGSSYVWSGYLLSVSAAIATLAGVYATVARAGERAALLAAALWAAVSMQPALGATIPNTEAFINAFIAAAIAWWLWRGDRFSGAIISGVLFGVATLYKQVAIAPAIAIAVVNLFWPAPNSTRWRAAVRSFVMLAMIPVLWLLCGAYFAATQRGSIFYFTNFVYSRTYAGNLAANLLKNPPVAAMYEILPLVLIALVGLIMLILGQREVFGRRDRSVIVAIFVGTYIAVVMPGQSFEHYLQLWLVPFVITGAIAADKIAASKLGVAVVSTILLGLVVLQLHWFLLSPRDRATRQHPASFYMDCVAVGSELRSLLRDDETMHCWCDEVYLYLLANKRPPAAGLWKSHTVFSGPVSQWLTQRTIEDLQKRPPDMVVSWAFYPGPEDHAIYRWIAAHYEPIPGNEKRFPLALLARRGSDLNRRTQLPP